MVKGEDASLAMGIIHLNVLGIPNHVEHIPLVKNSLTKGVIGPPLDLSQVVQTNRFLMLFYVGS